jgi:hypothetical protein
LSEAAARVMEPGLAEFLRRCDDRFVDQHFRMKSRSDAIPGAPAHVSRKKEPVVLAVEVGLSIEQLEAFEQGDSLDSELNRRVRRALERGGASFLSERRGRGLGVRLKFGRQLAKRIDVWENEGGPAAVDDVL